MNLAKKIERPGNIGTPRWKNNIKHMVRAIATNTSYVSLFDDAECLLGSKLNDDSKVWLRKASNTVWAILTDPTANTPSSHTHMLMAMKRTDPEGAYLITLAYNLRKRIDSTTMVASKISVMRLNDTPLAVLWKLEEN